MLFNIYLNYLLSQNNFWKLFLLHKTALIHASEKGYTEINKLLLGQEGNEFNSNKVSLFLSKFIIII